MIFVNKLNYIVQIAKNLQLQRSKRIGKKKNKKILYISFYKSHYIIKVMPK